MDGYALYFSLWVFIVLNTPIAKDSPQENRGLLTTYPQNLRSVRIKSELFSGIRILVYHETPTLRKLKIQSIVGKKA